MRPVEGIACEAIGGYEIRSANFGIAARAGKVLRSGLTASMPNATDRSVQNRFSGAIAKWLGT